jgi:hypothetical protein
VLRLLLRNAPLPTDRPELTPEGDGAVRAVRGGSGDASAYHDGSVFRTSEGRTQRRLRQSTVRYRRVRKSTARCQSRPVSAASRRTLGAHGGDAHAGEAGRLQPAQCNASPRGSARDGGMRSCKDTTGT